METEPLAGYGRLFLANEVCAQNKKLCIFKFSKKICTKNLKKVLYFLLGMFFKEIDKTPKKIINHNKINFGIFNSTPKKIDISGVHAPFTGFPLPSFITNTRIKSSVSFAFNLDEYIGLVDFCNLRFLGLAEVVFWNKKTDQKFSYHTILGPRRRFVPKNVVEAVCASYRKSRFIKIFWSEKLNRISLNFCVFGDNVRPSAKCVVHADYNQKNQHQILSVSPAPTERRCSASWFVPFIGTGGLKIEKNKKDLNWVEENPALGLLMLNRVYSSFRTTAETAFSVFENKTNKIMFHFANYDYDALDSDKYNDNFLFVDDEVTLLPSVVISHSFGINENWVIQDTENMVDLVFVPKSRETHSTNFIFAKNQYDLIYGKFEGYIISKNETKIQINSCGFVKKNLLRS